MEPAQLVLLGGPCRRPRHLGGVFLLWAHRGSAAPLALAAAGSVWMPSRAVTAQHFMLEPDALLTVILQPLLYAAARQVLLVEWTWRCG